jgi:hypothetical protein
MRSRTSSRASSGRSGSRSDSTGRTIHGATPRGPVSTIDLFEAGVDAEFPDAGTLIRDLADRSWIGPANAREIDRVRTLVGLPRIDGLTALAGRVVDDSALVIPYGNSTFPNYFSERIGCAFVQPAIGAVDLLSLCIKGASGGSSASPAPSGSPAP